MRVQKTAKLWSCLTAVALCLAFIAGCSANTGKTIANSLPAGTATTAASATPEESKAATAASTDGPGAASAIASAVNTVAPDATPNITKDDTDGDGIPDTVEKTYGTNPHAYDTDGDGQNDKLDKDPVYTDNLITETSATELPVKINDVRVEDNATADHLEITMTNTGTAELTGFDIYFTITDKVDGRKEAYYWKLEGLALKPGEKGTIHFDNLPDKNHYPGNMNGLYGTSRNGLLFNIQLHSTGFKPLDFTVEKAKGTAEVAD
jgi:hypothetical protein